MRKWLRVLLASLPAFGQSAGSGNSVKVALVKMPYIGERNAAERSGGPDYLEQGGIQKLLAGRGCETRPVSTVALNAEEQRAYGEWNRLGLANAELAKIIAGMPDPTLDISSLSPWRKPGAASEWMVASKKG